MFLCEFNVVSQFYCFYPFRLLHIWSVLVLLPTNIIVVDVFLLRSVDTLLVSIWGLHTMTSLSWLAIRADIVSLRSNAPKLDAVTTQAISRLGLWRRRGSRAGKHKHCDRPKFSSRASPTERKSMTSLYDITVRNCLRVLPTRWRRKPQLE